MKSKINKLLIAFVFFNFFLVESALCQRNKEDIKKGKEVLNQQPSNGGSAKPVVAPTSPIPKSIPSSKPVIIEQSTENESTVIDQSVNMGNNNTLIDNSTRIGNKNKIIYNYNPSLESKKILFNAPELQQIYRAYPGSIVYDNHLSSVDFHLVSIGAQGRVLYVQDTASENKRKFELKVSSTQVSYSSENYNKFSHRYTFESGNILHFDVEYEARKEDPYKLAFDIIIADIDGNIYKQRVRANTHQVRNLHTEQVYDAFFFIASPIEEYSLIDKKSNLENKIIKDRNKKRKVKNSFIKQSTKMGDYNRISDYSNKIGSNNIIVYDSNDLSVRKKLFSTPELRGYFAAEINIGVKFGNEIIRDNIEFSLTSIGSTGRFISIQDTASNAKYEYELVIADMESYDYRADYQKFARKINFKSGNHLHFFLYFNSVQNPVRKMAFDIIMADIYGNLYKQRTRAHVEKQGLYEYVFLLPANSTEIH